MAEVNNPQNTDYLNQRLHELGITDKLNTFTRNWTARIDTKDDQGIITTREVENTRDYKIFSADDNGNIRIRYFNLNGQPYRWKSEKEKKTLDFIRTRLKEPKEKMKYFQPAGSPPSPFFPPSIIDKYKKGEAIPCLYLIEGEFKAFKASMLDVDVAGIGGISNFYNGDIRGKIHEDLQELIIKCKVKKIVLLMDADVLKITWAEKEDLVKRPASFYGAINAFRESLQLLIDDDKVALEYAYFMHIKSKYMNDAKGLDDLLAKYADKSLEIIEDLYQHNFAKKYFEGFSINSLNHDVQGRVHKYLGLFNEQDFYKTYGEFIGAREFLFRRKRFVYDQEKKEVVFVKHEDANKYMRIGPDYVKIIQKPNKYGELEEEIVPWKKSEIKEDYKKYGIQNFMDQLQKYDDFVNEPSWNGSYKRVHNNCFNICNPLLWQPKEGSISSSIKFLKHIFGGQGEIILDDQGLFESEKSILGDQFTVALDYLTLLLKNPKQMLPVPILVSPEQNTGKSTFLKWLQQIWGSNMCIIGNEHFKMRFNSHYITKIIIGIDEGFLEVDKKSEKEKLKQMVTADTAQVEFKGMNLKKINYYGKIIICSNDADKVMKIEEGESRWFVVRVPVIAEKDPDIELKLKAEIEAFLYFLHNREVFHPKSDRLWFKAEWFITEQHQIIVEATKNRLDRVFEQWISDQFLLYKLPVLRYPLNYLVEALNDFKTSKYKIDGIELKAYLTKRKLKAEPTMRVKIPVSFGPKDPADPSSEIEMKYHNPVARPFVFNVAEWLNEEQMEEYKKPMNFMMLSIHENGNGAPGPVTSSNNGDGPPF